MSLTTAEIKRRLAAKPSKQRDNEAQSIINGATSADLRGVDAEGVLRLYEALALGIRIYSSNDSAAMSRLKKYTQFQPVTNTPNYGVNLVKNVRKLNSTLLFSKHVTQIYAAENKRLSFVERYIRDGSTIGRGQLGQPAYTDVKKPANFKSALETCVTRVFIAKLLKNAPLVYDSSHFDFTKYSVVVPQVYSGVYKYKAIEDFVVAAYLAIKIKDATKPKRSNADVLRFAVAIYHGMYTMVRAGQIASGDEVNWSPVEAELRAKGKTDEIAYVKEVVK